ncbi:hypothetical protein [Nocardioides sp. CER19]|uniref:hypothetical protein n=1 Tax=Nocardioides sp. CER19 TaxID=3038538 RepID=UPI00244D33A2|nr:hypothetical protein [Nocardioides sp. CER19]MDH2413056.1 hypothetical protein [Nocardioides sp. CER19]
MTTYRVWVFDSAEDGPAVLDALSSNPSRSDGLTGGSSLVALSWGPDEVRPRIEAIGAPSDLNRPDGLARRAGLFDVIFLEPLRRASRGEAPDDADNPASRFGLSQGDVSRLRDAVTPGRSAIVTTDAEMRGAIEETLTGRRPVAQWTIEPGPGA